MNIFIYSSKVSGWSTQSDGQSVEETQLSLSPLHFLLTVSKDLCNDFSLDDLQEVDKK